MTRKPAFWISFSAISIICTGFAFWFFPRAFPIVSLNITMNRSAAMAEAVSLAKQHGWGPQADMREAASFELDDKVQTFVELEGGGAEAFNKMLTDSIYTPYTWRVRLFREGDVNETNIRFRPDGRPFGFVEKIAEDTVRPNLSTDAARKLAEQTAKTDWQIDLTNHTLVESGQEKRQNGRIDHTFVYERDDKSLGDGRYRVRITVSGDRVSQVMPYIKVPEAFTRRYEEMRSANTAIGLGGSAGAVIYLLGCGIGLFYLLRKRALLWRPAVKLAAVIAIVQVLRAVNAWPLSWMTYDTAIPAGRFVLQSLLPVIFSNLLLAVVMAFSFLAAEGLSRLAFPQHPQLWRIWGRAAAPTVEVTGRTATGYLLVPLMLAYIMIFYFVAGRVGGWWNPSDALVNPDSLAHYAPWFTPFSMAMQAGIWEESLFRAVPLATAALIGQRYGRRGLFIGIGLVIEALVFGSAHATYPTQPAYARLVELIIPSLVFGLLYLRFGLLPAMILHFSFDNVLMSLPIFASSGSDVWLDRALVILLILIPALVIVVRRLQTGNWSVMPDALRNAGWQVPATTVTAPVEPEPAEPVVQNTWSRWLIPVLTVVCLVSLPAVAWLQIRSRLEVPVLGVTKAQAEQIARRELASRGVELKPGTRLLISVVGSPSLQDRFIWQTEGKSVYERMVGDWIHPPRYMIRFARFEGDVAQRADEWYVTVTGSGVVRTVRHVVAESASGAKLDEAQARKLAFTGLDRELHIKPDSVREVSVEPKQQPARTDWTFTFADRTGKPLSSGERRIQVDIAGNEVLGAVKLIHIPEEWQRQQRADSIFVSALSILRRVVIFGLLAAGAIAGIVVWSRGRFSLRYFLLSGVAVLFAGAGLIGNNLWPTISARFSTAQPFFVQAAVILIALAILLGMSAVGSGLITGMVLPWRKERIKIRSGRLLLAAALLAVAMRSLSAFTVLPFQHAMPTWPAVAPAIDMIPLIGQLLAGVTAFITNTVIMLLVFGVADRYTAGWTRKRTAAVILLFLIGSLLYGSSAGGTVALWVLSAVVIGSSFAAGYWLLFRHDLAVIPVFTATSLLLNLIPVGEQPYPGAAMGNVLAMAVIAVLGWLLFRAMRNNQLGSTSELVHGS